MLKNIAERLPEIVPLTTQDNIKEFDKLRWAPGVLDPPWTATLRARRELKSLKSPEAKST